MSIDPQIVAELRAMFLHGATPSRLLRHIAERHESDPDWTVLVDPYFDEAFRVVPFVRPIQGLNASLVDLDRLDLSALNGELLRDMVGRSGGWREDGSAWWGDSDVSPDDLKMIDRIRPESHPALGGCWPMLPPQAQQTVRQAMANAQAYYERCQVLMRLVERLQQQVIESERQAAGV